MSDDPLVQRLRVASDTHIAHGDRVDTDLLDAAADRIEALEAENAALIHDDPNRTSVFEYLRDADGTVTACRTVTTTAWRPL